MAAANRHCGGLAGVSDQLPIPVLDHGSSARTRYTPRGRREVRTIVWRGQRKLLMSEIGLLLRLERGMRYIVVYAGAAPGIHIPFLSGLFPDVIFHLYDPSPFRIANSDTIRTFQEFFDDATAQRYAGRNDVVFISDIRLNITEQFVIADMLAQQRWHEIIKPELTSLKFRLPWPGSGEVDASNVIEYLDGEIVLPIWGRTSTTESRLVIVKGEHSGKKRYNCLAYEEEMSHFNRVTRPSIHFQPVRNGILDGCFDCASEVALLTQYAESIGNGADTGFVAHLSERISTALRVGI